MIFKTIKEAFNKVIIFSIIASLALGILPVFGEESTIKDLDKSSSFARQAVTELAARNIITGDEYGNFNPIQNITRGQMIVILTRVMNLDISKPPLMATFTDVPKTHWAFPYVEAAYKNGIVTGITKDKFGINDLCTREQMAVIFVRALGISESDINAFYGSGSISSLSDQGKIGTWSKSYVAFALSTGLMTGTSSKTFGPKEYAKREQAAVVTHRFINNKDSIINLPPKDLALSTQQIATLQKSVVKIKTYAKTGVFMAEGSGFAVAKGLFLTNYHVLEGASKYTITDSSGKNYEVQGIVKYDINSDLAIIKTKELTSIAPLKLGSKSSVVKADQVIAIGYPQSVQNIVSYGIISGIRKFEFGKTGAIDMLQTTAAISEGSFGGALIDMGGNVVGVASSVSEDGNLRFAVAIDHAKAWIQELQTKSFSSIPVLDMSKSIAAYLDFSEEGIKEFIYKVFRIMEARDVNAYMTTVHPFAPGYKMMEEEYKKFFWTFNLDYDIYDLQVVEKSYTSAEVNIIYTAKQPDRYEHDTLRIYGRYSLEKYNGEWKVYYASETAKEYSNEVRHDIGMGAVSKEEAKWAYEEQMKNLQNEIKINGIELDYKVAEAIMHPTKPVIYASDMYSKKVFAYNYATGQTKEVKFDLTPENLTFSGNEIYVALLKGKHSPYWWTEEQKGAIAIIDSETLQIKEQFDIDIDPLDIVAGRDGHIYVTSGSGQHSLFKSYSRMSLQEVSTARGTGGSYAELHPNKNIIYTISNSSPRDIVMYDINQGKYTDADGKDTYYHGQYEIGKKFILSPDGNYLISSVGTIFATNMGYAAYHTTIDREFMDAVFAADGKSFYISLKGGLIYQYSYPGFKGINTYKMQGEIIKIFHRDGKLMAITTANNKSYLETVQ